MCFRGLPAWPLRGLAQGGAQSPHGGGCSGDGGGCLGRSRCVLVVKEELHQASEVYTRVSGAAVVDMLRQYWRSVGR